MKFASLDLEHFGATTHLQLADLSEDLNLIYGPNGSGKSTVVQFLRWVLYGEVRSSRRAYVSETNGHVSGSVTITVPQKPHQVFRRESGNTSAGRLSVHDIDGSSLDVGQQNMVIGVVDLNEFDHLFCFDFDQPKSSAELISVAQQQGFELAHNDIDLTRLNELIRHREGLQTKVGRLSYANTSLESLHQRQNSLRQAIEALREACRKRLDAREREHHGLVEELAERKRVHKQTTTDIRGLQRTLEQRQQRLEGTLSELDHIRCDALQQRRQQLQESDEQLAHWNNVQALLREQQERLAAKLEQLASRESSDSEQDQSELRSFLTALGLQMDGLEQDSGEVVAVDDEQDLESQLAHLRTLLGQAASSMRDDLSRLTGTLSNLHREKQSQQYEVELTHLRRCHAEMTELIDSISARRQQTANAVELLESRIQGAHARSGQSSDNSATHKSGTSVLHRESEWLSRYDGMPESRLWTGVLGIQKRIQWLEPRVTEAGLQVRNLEDKLERLQQVRESDPEQRELDLAMQQLQDVENEIRAWEQRQRLLEQIKHLDDQIDLLRHHTRQSDVVQQAETWLRRMTLTSFQRVKVTPEKSVTVEDANGTTIQVEQLGRGSRDQVYLALALALAEGYRQKGQVMPLVLSNVFSNVDSHRARATAECLEEFVAMGHQLLLFSRHDHVTSLFDGRCRLHRLDAPVPTMGPAVQSVPPLPVPQVASLWSDNSSRYRGKSPVVVAESAHIQVDTQSKQDPVIRVLLEHGRPIEEAPNLDPASVANLHAIDVRFIRDILELSPSAAASQLARYGITSDQIQQWQSEVLLHCYLKLTGDESRLLVASGIHNPTMLADVEAEVLLQKLDHVAATTTGQANYGYDLRTVSHWIATAHRCSFRRRLRVDEVPKPAVATQSERGTRQRGRSPASSTPKTRRAKRTASSKGRVQSTVKMADASPLHFRLELTDPVIDAPSIGGKTAEKFHAIGVKTIDDLLRLKPDVGSKKLNDRRIKAETIQLWQAQTRLVYRIPNLHGHDAQILVACGVQNPTDLAQMDVKALLRKVSRFCGTTEGKRVLRNSQRPNQNEVRNWIRWSQETRQLRAA